MALVPIGTKCFAAREFAKHQAAQSGQEVATLRSSLTLERAASSLSHHAALPKKDVKSRKSVLEGDSGMAQARISFGVLAIAILSVSAATAAPPPTPAQMLQFKPRQPGIAISTPTDAEIAACKVELVKGSKLANGKQATGWILKDSTGRPLRRFFDSDGDNQIDVWSYYLNGEECFREIDSNFNGKVDQYRWLGPNGSKWGVDINEDGKIDTWKVISAEEASQEILAAIQTRDFARLQALMINKSDLDALDLPDSEANRIKTKVLEAGRKFQATLEALPKVTEKTKWIHLETGAPECSLAETLGSKADLIRHRHATILYSDGDRVHDFIQTGEMILIGRAWRIVEAPYPGTSVGGQQVGTDSGINIPEKVRALVDKLKPIDEKYKAASTPAEVVEYNLARAAVLEEIIAALAEKDREEWTKQVSDCYSTAAQNGDKTAHERLTTLRTNVTKAAPGSALAAYVVYREMSAEYALKLMKAPPEQMAKLQDEWKERLTKFTTEYPTAEDTPDALMQLGMVNEFTGKETDAKNWYGQLVKNFERNAMAPKAAGALKRLGLDGQEFELTGPTLGAKTAFDVKSLKGKIVLVYYWSSNNTQAVADFAKLKVLLKDYGPKGVELVAVNLDYREEDAARFLQQNTLGGIHLFQAGGSDSPLAIQYGMIVLPHLFLVSADGKVINRNAQSANVEDELKKILK
jgi:hypothetical protein